jgi:predicted CopG family antitoxin
MPTKTISIDLDAYERLRKARRTPDESFSRVIKRAHWHEAPRTAAALLEALSHTPAADGQTIQRLDEAQEADVPPEDAWRSR